MTEPIPESLHVSHRYPARFAGTRCALDPTHRIELGEAIGHVERRGGGRTRVKLGWVCAACADRITEAEKSEGQMLAARPVRLAIWPDIPAGRLANAARNPSG